MTTWDEQKLLISASLDCLNGRLTKLEEQNNVYKLETSRELERMAGHISRAAITVPVVASAVTAVLTAIIILLIERL